MAGGRVTPKEDVGAHRNGRLVWPPATWHELPRPAEGGSGAFAVLVLKLESTMVPKIPGVAVSRVDFAWKNLSDILITVCV